MTRADRRHRTELVIAKRTRVMKSVGMAGDLQRTSGHKLAKRDGLGLCSNRGCSICAAHRGDKRKKVRAERKAGRKAEARGLDPHGQSPPSP